MLQWSWRKKLFTFFALVALIPLGISGWNMIGITTDEITSNTNESLSADAGQVAGAINNFYKSGVVDPIGTLKTSLENPDLGGNEKASILSSIVKKSEDIIYAELFFKQEGQYISAIKVLKDNYLAEAQKSGKEANIFEFSETEMPVALKDKSENSAPFYFPSLQRWMMNVTVPIRIPGSPEAVLVTRVDLTRMEKFITGFYSGNVSRQIFLINNKGEKLFAKQSQNVSGTEIVKQALSMLHSQSRVQGALNYSNSQDEKIVGCYAFPENLDWAIIAEIKEADAYQMVGKIKFSLMLWVLVGLGIAMSGGVLFSNDISKPIIKLSKAAETISSGNFDIKVDYKGKDSIGVLGSTLVNMSQSLKSSFAQIADQNRQLEEYNKNLEQKVADRTTELKEKNTALEDTLFKLKETQEQLVMSQKLASLGQLTAGIAHEIKNPLNFVNNFAKLSVGLVDELREEMDRSKDENAQPDFGYVDEILGDIQTNVTKISEHGGRADNIVKNMLEHSRMDNGEFVKTELNKLLDESVHLAFHGIRNVVEDFNCSLDLQFEKGLSIVNLNPQALSQVFINLFNNSFYAMNKRRLVVPGFAPVLKVSTSESPEWLTIVIRDNGTGIPAQNLQKIFEPFFTTKPTGEGTGLGLSISYDIISQIHRGEMTAVSEEGSFTEFTIKLPKTLSSI
ncbi:MAG: HAMP domain-containing protein [Ignavibacteriales bacterium]|nr:HAMP domain-containing protein [Ignavibacteriales bacterium]